MIRTVAVIGTGLIGTSVALAVRRCGVSVLLADRSPDALRAAVALGAGRPLPGPQSRHPGRPVDLAVLAVPPSQVGPVLAAAQRGRLAAVYTDVASVKAGPERAALAGAPDPASYVGGHPIAGRELSGPRAARADLFRGRAWALTPSPLTTAAALGRGRELVELCGAVPVVTDSGRHDATVALTSHAPHLVASLLAARLHDAPAEVAQLCGQGLRDTTRIARGDPRLWGDILQANAAAVGGVLGQVSAELLHLMSVLAELAAPDAAGVPAAGGEPPVRGAPAVLGGEPPAAGAAPAGAAQLPGGPDRQRARRELEELLERGVRGLERIAQSGNGAAPGAVPAAGAYRPVVLDG